MTEDLRKPTTREAPPINPQPELALVQDEGEKQEVTEVQAGPQAEEGEEPFPGANGPPPKAEITVESVKKVRRKRKPRKKKAVKTNPMSLTKMEMMELDLNQARVDMQATVLQNLQMKEKILSGEYAKQRDHLRLKQRDTAISMEQCKEEYNQTRISIQERLGISLDECTVRQDGVIIPIDKDGNPEYMGDGG